MSIYLVAHVEAVTHVCPANAEPHVVQHRQQILAITPGGPCRAPVTIRSGGRTVAIDCGRHEPADRQCGACRTRLTYPIAIRTAA